jgi:hypothetical protein
MTKPPTAFFAALMENGNQGPILMETEMENAQEHTAGVTARRFMRGCVVRCEFESGNRLLFDQMCDGAERHREIREHDETEAKRIPF